MKTLSEKPFLESFETFKMFLRRIITEFVHKIDV